MQTGFGDGGDGMVEQYIQTMTNLLLPVMERSTVLAAEYSKSLWKRYTSPRRYGICDEILCYVHSW